MRDLISRFRIYFVFAGFFSLVINALLLVPPIYMLQVFDRVLASRSEETLVYLTVGGFSALVIMALLDMVRARLLGVVGAALDRRLGPRVLDGLIAQTARLGGSAYVNGLRDVNTLRTFLGGPGLLALFDAPWLPFFLLIIFLFHPLLGAVALTGALAMVATAALNERLTRKPTEEAQMQARRAGRYIDGAVRNADVVAALGMLPAVARRWSEVNDAALRQQIRASRIGGVFSGLTKFARQFIQLAMLAAGAWLVVDQHVTAGIMIAATILLSRALAPVETLVAGWRTLIEARLAWRRLDELLRANPPMGSEIELPTPSGRLEVDRVLFGMKGAERPIIRGVSFALAPGEALGVVGPSAAGKSTLARLVVGVWKPAAGVVRLDGADVAAWPRERLGPHIGYLPQDVELFAGTVASNIARLGEPDSAEVVRAAQRAHVHELILRLPKGYDTEVGEGGQLLSPGQRQRIGLARALYGNPRLIVLDEPNANLDIEGERALQAALRGMKALEREFDARPLVRAGLLILLAGILVLGAWAVIAPLSGAVIAPGFVKIDLNRKVVQHQEGGIVSAIRVRDGDRVKAGQELIVLDDVRVDAQLDLLRTQYDTERAKAARLEAERGFRERVVFPRDIADRQSDPKINELIIRESALFRARRESVDTQIAVLRKQIKESTSEAEALSAQLAAEEKALKLQKEELTANERLLDQGYVQKTRILTLERAVAEYEAKYGEHRAQASQARQRATELEFRILAIRNDYAQKATDELKDTTSRLFDLEERIRPSKDASERQRILAPIAGEVVGLRVFTPGSVIGPRDVLMEIVPDDKRLIIEARIRPEDINHVRAGSHADIRLTAYKQRTTPLVEGEVSYVSGDRMVDEQNKAPYYVVHVNVSPQSLTQAGNLTMTAGMPAEVYIRTDERTTFDYLTAPVTGYLRRAMREPL